LKLFSKITGNGHPLLILHGLFGSHENWSTIASLLSNHFQIHALDLRNHGRSSQSPNMSYPLMVEDLAEYLNDQNLASAHVLGHSMGGKVAMQLALTHPERVAKLVIVDIAPRAYAPRHREILDGLLSLNLKALQTRSQMEQALAPRIPELEVRQFLLKNAKRDEHGSFYWQMNLNAINANYPLLNAAIPAAKPFGHPALLICGEASDYVLPEDVEEMRKVFPNLQSQTIAGTGHWVHAEAPKAFADAVAKWLAEP
jgi:esterase